MAQRWAWVSTFFSFYTGNFPEMKQDDPFRKDLLGCLSEATKAFKGRETMKHVFMLSLLSEIDPSPPKGKSSLDEALKLSFACATAQPPSHEGSSSDLAQPHSRPLLRGGG